MSLKGYEFLDDNGNVQACFFFKRLNLIIYKDISEERLEEIKTYIKEKGDKILSIEYFN